MKGKLNRLWKRGGDESGVISAFVVVLLVGLLAVMAFAIDVGAWYRAQRNTQTGADAAALAGAQDLPNTGTATSTATTYAANNVSNLNSWTPTFPDTSTIDVQLSKPTPGFFARVLGISTVTVHAHARAQVGSPAGMKNLAAIVVNQNLACPTGGNCFGPTHPVDLNFDGTPGSGAAAGLIDLVGHNPSQSACTSSASTADIKGWIEVGYGNTLPVNEWYGAPPGAKNGVQSSLNAVIGKTLFYPVFDTGTATACGGQGGFHIIGWSAFVITQVLVWNNSAGGSHTLRGYFVEYIAHDLELSPGVPGFGVKVIKLSE